MGQCKLAVVALLLLPICTEHSFAAGEQDGIGLRGGFAQEPSQFVIGGQIEEGPVLGPAFFVPSMDLQLGHSHTLLAINADLRWYLLPLPDTGVYFYGAGGPTLVLGGNDAALGLSLIAGTHIPMNANRRYNVEVRFGFADIPDLKVLLAVVWDR